ncbi:MAG TPA: butyrate kinase [Acetomicrobium flavidum]|uniref:butyrate kinase n=1 Tax=Acetomicrobium flavidum TaxID=49896 RepID=UPI0016977380|nr:butyrate kinase [Acetomicrobium flavidum]HOJ82718.1 butyrate kinase [Acetomicrobium flavidum]HOM31675.1 butyrate kinase [Acetomicrobium flavidum]HPP14883.1 butyrate kinase [Acetomicrobium flavidum]
MGLPRILAINPGSTSTKIAYFEGDRECWRDTQRYDIDVLKNFSNIIEQEGFRLEEIKRALRAHGTKLEDIDAFVGRGGLLHPIPAGTYRINDLMLEEMRACKYGVHASNLGAILAHRLAKEAGGKPCFIVDPVVVDELCDEARISGFPEIERKSIFHALNQKATARRVAKELGKKYDELRLVVAHLGGGISVGAHLYGKVVDVNNALDGEGPFSPERSGTLPAGQLVNYCYSGKVTLDEMLKKLVGQGGMVAHLGTNDVREVEKRIAAGDKKAELVYNAMAYQVAKAIAEYSAVLSGQVDAIVITGSIAYSDRFVDLVTRRVSFIAPIFVYPGEDEMLALAQGALRVLTGEEEAKEYAY